MILDLFSQGRCAATAILGSLVHIAYVLFVLLLGAAVRLQGLPRVSRQLQILAGVGGTPRRLAVF